MFAQREPAGRQAQVRDRARNVWSLAERGRPLRLAFEVMLLLWLLGGSGAAYSWWLFKGGRSGRLPMHGYLGLFS